MIKKFNNKTLIILFTLGIIYFCIKKKNKMKELFSLVFKKLKKSYEKFTCQKDIVNTDLKYIGDINKYDAQKDFEYHSENLNSADAENLYKFLQSMIKPNNTPYSKTAPFSKKIKVNADNEKILLNFLNVKLDNNISSKKIKNINLLDKIFYFKNSSCLELQPFQISGDYYSNRGNLGKVKIQIELSFRFDKPNTIFLSQTVFNNYMGVFEFNRITLVGHEFKVDVKKKSLPVNIDKPITYSKYDFEYSKPNNIKESNILDTVNSLIPENIDITEYEADSEIIQTINKVKV